MTSPTPRANWQDIIEAHDENRGTAAPQFSNRDLLMPADRFVKRHIGPRSHDVTAMLHEIGLNSLDELVDQAIPASIRMDGFLAMDPPRSEQAILDELRRIAGQNKVYRSFIGMGYYGTITPPVVQRNVLENPGWYTAYTPYQPEISQGRLEALINFQTMITDLTGLEIANASLLDESTAAAEAMTLCHRALPRNSKANVFFVSDQVHPQTIAVVRTRAEPFGFKIVVGDHSSYDFAEPTFGVLVQYPATNGDVYDYRDFAAKAHAAGALVVAATDLLSLVLLTPPGEWGADVALGNSQRFGVPMGYGGPHAAFFATKDEYKRIMPGRLVGVSIDATGKKGYRLTLTTREQHIRREKATSNICTAQVLLAVMASMYAVYHGPVGLRRIATRVHLLTEVMAAGLKKLGYEANNHPVFDTLTVHGGRRQDIELRGAALAHEINLRYNDDGSVGLSLDETVTIADLEKLFVVFGAQEDEIDISELADAAHLDYAEGFQRQSDFMTHPVFNSYLSETEMMRYIKRLENRDISLVHSMIPLGSCTMKLNAAAEMLSITLPGFAALHPFVPLDQAQGYQELFHNLESWLTEITGFAGCSLQPNSGAQGEYTGMLTIRAYQIARGQGNRHICLIPASAHGTNPASAALAGMEVVVVATDDNGNINVEDMRAKAEQHRDNLSALMVTYPSTHGVYEQSIGEICKIIHDNGGQVYMDGANMNALVAICRPGDFGPDVLHLNLHKTFSIPHGGGPGMGPICVAEHLTPFLPGHPVVPGVGGVESLGTVSAAPWGSASILPIPYAYIGMMGEWGLRVATEIAILNANYIAEKLEPHYPVLYRGLNGRIAHECIVDPRHLKDTAGVTAEDITKRLMDFGFHAPTLSFPVPGTLMIEPTESESKEELDRFIDAMIIIREEIRAIEEGRMDHDNNPLKHAPHTAEVVLADEWDRPYSREQASCPAEWVRRAKVWPFVSRIDNVYGDRNLFCVCIPIEEYA